MAHPLINHTEAHTVSRTHRKSILACLDNADARTFRETPTGLQSVASSSLRYFYVGIQVVYVCSTTFNLRSPLFWDFITQRGMALNYRRLGTTYSSHLEWSSSPRMLLDCLTLEDGTNKLSRIVGMKMPPPPFFPAKKKKAQISHFGGRLKSDNAIIGTSTDCSEKILRAGPLLSAGTITHKNYNIEANSNSNAGRHTVAAVRRHASAIRPRQSSNSTPKQDDISSQFVTPAIPRTFN